MARWYEERGIPRMRAISYPLIVNTGSRAVQVASAQTGVGFDLLQQGLTDYAAEEAEFLAGVMGETAADWVIHTVQRGLEEGRTVQGLRRELEQHPAFNRNRAQLVARTETTRAWNGAQRRSLQTYQEQSGNQVFKVWTSALDDRVRPEHAELHGEQRPIDQPFSNGLMEPGEPNCRCTLTYSLAQAVQEPPTQQPGATEPTEPTAPVDVPQVQPLTPEHPDVPGSLPGIEEKPFFQQALADPDVMYASGNADDVFGRMAADLGADRLPTIVSDAEMDSIISEGGVELWRGEKTRAYAEQFLGGDLFPGSGIYGSGTYTAYGTGARNVALQYAGGSSDSAVMRLALRSDARIINVNEINEIARQLDQEIGDKVRAAAAEAAESGVWTEANRLNAWHQIVKNNGRLALALGYDAIEIPGQGYMAVVNRGALVGKIE